MKAMLLSILLALTCAGLTASTPDRRDDNRREVRCYRSDCHFRHCDRNFRHCDRNHTHCVWQPCCKECQPGDCAYERCRGYYKHVRTDADQPRRFRHHRYRSHCCHD